MKRTMLIVALMATATLANADTTQNIPSQNSEAAACPSLNAFGRLDSSCNLLSLGYSTIVPISATSSKFCYSIHVPRAQDIRLSLLTNGTFCSEARPSR